MTPEQLAEIRARAEAATSGPWVYRGNGFESARVAARDMQFVAHARTDILALLDYIEELQAVLREAHIQLQDNGDMGHVIAEGILHNALASKEPTDA